MKYIFNFSDLSGNTKPFTYEIIVEKDINITIHKGEIFAIAGVSGNGQVEIADAIAGTIPISSGNIYLKGKDITKEIAANINIDTLVSLKDITLETSGKTTLSGDDPAKIDGKGKAGALLHTGTL